MSSGKRNLVTGGGAHLWQKAGIWGRRKYLARLPSPPGGRPCTLYLDTAMTSPSPSRAPSPGALGTPSAPATSSASPTSPAPAYAAPIPEPLQTLFRALAAKNENAIAALLHPDVQIDIVGPSDVPLFGYTADVSTAIERLRWWHEHIHLDRLEWFSVAAEAPCVVVSGIIQFRVRHTQCAVQTPWMLAISYSGEIVSHIVAYVDSAAVQAGFFPPYVPLSHKLLKTRTRRRG